jgi:hypothetical protein
MKGTTVLTADKCFQLDSVGVSRVTPAFMDNRVERLTFARLLRDSALELLLTLFMLFGVTSIIRWVIEPAPISRMIPQIHAELLIVGASVGIGYWGATGQKSSIRKMSSDFLESVGCVPQRSQFTATYGFWK